MQSAIIKRDAKIFASDEMLSEYKKVLKRDFEYSDEKILGIVEKLFLFLILSLP